MIANYYTLRQLTHNLHRRLAGGQFTAIFTQQRQELILSFERADGSAGHMIVSCDPLRNALYMRDEFHRARKNSLDLLQPALHRTISDIAMSPADRRITITMNAMSVVIELFGARANVYCIDQNRMIVDAFLRARDAVGKPLTVSKELRLPTTPETFAKLFQESDTPAWTALKRCNPLLGTELAREVLFRAGIEESIVTTAVTEAEVSRLFTEHESLHRELLARASPRIYYDDTGTPHTFAILPLRHLGELECRGFDSMHEAVRIFLGSTHKHSNVVGEKKRLLHTLQQQLDRAERTLQKIQEESAAVTRAAEYELFGNLLKANLHQLSKGMRDVHVENLFSPQCEQIRIPLEPALGPAKNVERYFEKARKAHAALEEKSERKHELERRIETVRRLMERLEDVESADALQSFVTENANTLASVGIKTATKKAAATEEVPFRVFTVAGGFQVWAGKNSANNDLLTQRYAKPNDLWFHARGAGGSHVVLRVGTGRGEPSKQAIEQAAAIAAYYSKMKNASFVPVAMTEKKYVRKPKGAPAGTVVLEREKTIFVRPALPMKGYFQRTIRPSAP